MFERTIAELPETGSWRQSIDKAQSQRLFCRYVAEDPALVIEVARARSFEESALKCETVVHRFKVRPERAKLAAPPVEELERVQNQTSIRDADEIRPRADPAAVMCEEI